MSFSPPFFGRIAYGVRWLLTGKKACLIIIVMVLAARTLQLTYLLSTRSDMTYQILAAQSFYTGHGVSAHYILSTDLSTTLYKPEIKWPPGFSLLFVPFNFIFQNNYLVAVLAMSLVFAFVLVIVCRKILAIYQLPSYAINLFTLITGFSLPYFYLKHCTDAVAITFFTIAVYWSLSLLKTRRHYAVTMCGITAALLLTGSIKYLYIPLVPALPIYLYAKAFFEKDRKLKNWSILSFLTILVVFGSLLLWQKYVSDSVAYIQQPERGFFPANLFSLHPFIPAAILKPETLIYFFPALQNVQQIVTGVYQVIHLVTLFGASRVLVKKVIAKRKFFSVETDLTNLTFLLALSTTMLLTVLSLIISKEWVHNGSFWTYVQEPRYYGMIHVLMPILLFIFYFGFKNFFVGQYRKAFYLLFALLLVEGGRGLIFTVNRVRLFSSEVYGWQYEKEFQLYTAGIVDSIKKTGSSQNIVLTGSSDWMTLRAGLFTRLPIFEKVNQINTPEFLNAKKSVVLLAILRQEDLPAFRDFHTQPLAKEVGRHKNFLFYTYQVKPH